MMKPKFRMLESRYYQNKVPLVALDYYERDSHGEDDFSRKQVWFYTYGDREIEKEFKESLVDIFRSLFSEDDIEWDLVTLYPSHVQNAVNSNMMGLIRDVASEVDISAEQIIRRNETVSQNHELEKEKAKVVNIEGSIEVKKDLTGMNIILVDNIVLSGVSMLNGASKLINRGAENVFTISLGTSLKHEDQTSNYDSEMTAADLINGG